MPGANPASTGQWTQELGSPSEVPTSSHGWSGQSGCSCVGGSQTQGGRPGNLAHLVWVRCLSHVTLGSSEHKQQQGDPTCEPLLQPPLLLLLSLISSLFASFHLRCLPSQRQAAMKAHKDTHCHHHSHSQSVGVGCWEGGLDQKVWKGCSDH